MKTKQLTHIGKKIHDDLKSQGRSARWLASELGYSYSNIHKIFNTPSPNINTLRHISQLLGVNYVKIIVDEIDEFTKSEQM